MSPETQKSIREALEVMANSARHVFSEEIMCQRVYLGDGMHAEDQASWNVYAYLDEEYVGTIEVVWPNGPGGHVAYEGVLFSDIGPTFRVTDVVIATVLLHLGVELGRRNKKKVVR
jgi:hypothetical protein